MKEVILFQRNYDGSECPEDCAAEDDILCDIMKGIEAVYEP